MGSDSHDSHATVASNETPGALKFVYGMFSIIDGPATFFREKIVEPLREKNKQVYYHRQYNRVPTVDQCDVDDMVCIHEANMQMKRDKRVDREITDILNGRVEECMNNYGQHDGVYKCKELKKDLDDALTNYFVKYGELGASATVVEVYMKQKHRLIWQRRNPNVDLFGINKGTEENQKAAQEAMARVYAKDRFF